MKEIKAIIQPFKLNDVLTALHKMPSLPAVTVADVRGIDVASGSLAQVTKTKLEIMVPDELVPAVVGAIQAHAHTGKVGDGRIFIITIEDTVLIRSGQHDQLVAAVPNSDSCGDVN